MSARVAVLLPVRNGEATLAAALESLRRQSCRGFRVLAIDDASTDGTPWILERTARAWRGSAPAVDPESALHARPAAGDPDRDGPVLEWIRLDRPAGIAAALQAAAGLVRGEEFLARQDADDRSAPDRLAKQVAWLDAHPRIGVLATGVYPVADSTEGWKRYESWLAACRTPEEIALNLWIESPLPHPTVMMRRLDYERAGGYRRLPWPEDYDLWLRMLRLGVRMARLDEALYEWADSPGRASRTLPEYGRDRFLLCRAHHLARFLAECIRISVPTADRVLPDPVAARSVILWGAGRDGRRTARALLREGVEIQGFLDIDPRKIGRRAYGRPIHEAESWLREPSRPMPLILAAVGAAGAREIIRERLRAEGLVEGRQFLCLA